MRAAVSPNEAFTTRWSVGDTSIATVFSDGLLTAKKPGTTQIRADLTFTRTGAAGVGAAPLRVKAKP